MRGFLINPFERTLTEVDYDGDFHSIYKLCDYSTFVIVNDHPLPQLDVFVDDEGLFKEAQAFFTWGDYPQPLSGKGLILGHDLSGESVAVDATYEQIKEALMFVEPLDCGFGVIWCEVPFAEDDETESECGDAD